MKLVSGLPRQSFWLYLAPVLTVLTLLLVFFLLGSSFVVQSGVHVALPSSASRLAGFDRAHVITVPAGGDTTLYLDGRPQSMESLKEELTKLRRDSHRIIIHADAMAPFGRVMDSYNIVLALGFDAAFATEPPQSRE
jgi:biopolymer transport protein ExbD